MERTVTFTMEDALISPEGFMILSGAGLIEASADDTIKQHITETIDKSDCTVTDQQISIKLTNKPYLPTDEDGNFAYVMLVKDGEIVSEPYIPYHEEVSVAADGTYSIRVTPKHTVYDGKSGSETEAEHETYSADFSDVVFDSVIVDYYTERTGNAKQIEITADKFGGNYYLEASTLFRDQNGVDMPAEFIIPNCKIQSNFTFTMASSGDPSELMRLAA